MKENSTKKNYFAELAEINVSDKVEKKNGLSYLSWAWAWGELKKRYPTANYEVKTRDDGRIYWDDGRTAWVVVSVSIPQDGERISHTEILPIMDVRNRSIPVENITSMDANKAIQRALTKAIARHGLGLYIYAGEDLPEIPSDEACRAKFEAAVSVEEMREIYKALRAQGVDKAKLDAWGQRRKIELEADAEADDSNRSMHERLLAEAVADN